MGQSVNVKFCVKLQKSPSETLEMLRTVCGESIMNKSNVFQCHKRFREGRENVSGDETQGALVTKRTDESVPKITKLVRSERRLT
jgi:hypothetical protein